MTCQYLGSVFFWGGFRKCNSPEGLAKETPKIMTIQRCFDMTGYTMALTIFICELDAKNNPDTFKPVPDLF